MISPRTSKERTLKLEKWVIKEKEDIINTKKIIEEAKKKTEDIIREAQNNGNFLKQIMVDKITPRDNIRSGIHSERKRYEEMQKMPSSEHAKSDPNASSNSREKSDSSKNQPDLKEDPANYQNINKEIDLTNKNVIEESNSNSEGNISVDTPLIPSDDHESSFNNTGKIILGPGKEEGDSSEDSKEEILDSNKPISLEIKCKEDPSSDNDEPKKADDATNSHTLSRKKSAQRLTNIESTLQDDKTKPKSTVTPSPLNSHDFFSKDFDEMDMEDVMKNYSSTNLEHQNEEEEPNEATEEDQDDTNFSKDYNLIKQVKTKIKKTKESRNSDIKETKNLDDEKADQYGLQNDVDFHMKKMKVSKEDSRSDQRNTSLKVSKSGGSYKEDIILDSVLDNNLEETKDPKNITGSQSLENKLDSPDKIHNDSENSSKTDTLANSDSKYATVSILSELSQKEAHPQEENANKLADLIYSAMIAEIKAELFPPRPLFLLTADLDKIELEQAMVYLNDMSIEKEAELLKEFLKYSGSDDIDLSSWEEPNDNEK